MIFGRNSPFRGPGTAYGRRLGIPHIMTSSTPAVVVPTGLVVLQDFASTSFYVTDNDKGLSGSADNINMWMGTIIVHSGSGDQSVVGHIGSSPNKGVRIYTSGSTANVGYYTSGSVLVTTAFSLPLIENKAYTILWRIINGDRSSIIVNG